MYSKYVTKGINGVKASYASYAKTVTFIAHRMTDENLLSFKTRKIHRHKLFNHIWA